MQFVIHYFLHLVFPLFIAKLFFKTNWQRAYIIMLLSMVIDLDHLLANPLLQVNRCSICYHPLHSSYAIIVYLALLFFKGDSRILGVALLMHIATDFIDCIFIYNLYESYFIDEAVLTLFNHCTYFF